MDFSENPEIIQTKEKATDIVTKADIASQEIIVNAIQNKYPDHGIVSEEIEEQNTDAEYVWYIDPLDGTKNFATKTWLFGINIALAKQGKMHYAAIYLPATKELCYAEREKGAYLSGKKIQCSKNSDWRTTYGLGQPVYTKAYAEFQKRLSERSKGTAWINALGPPSVAAIWVADGRRDWYIGPSNRSYDYAAPSLIAKEAGCKVSNFRGSEWKPGDTGIILANNYFFPKLLEMVRASFEGSAQPNN